MSVLITESVWLNESGVCSLEELAHASGFSCEELEEFVASGVLETVEAEGGGAVAFQADCIVIARTARRLRDDFELDACGVGLAISLLRRIERLEAQVEELSAKLPRRF
jgi:chaperone modulatory protein CbpM